MPSQSCCAVGSGIGAPREEKLDEPLLDLEKGPPRLPIAPPPEAVKETASRAAHGRSRARIARCFIRGLLALMWVFLADLLRRFVVAYGDEPSLIVLVGPLSLIAVTVTLLVFTLMEECFPSLK